MCADPRTFAPHPTPKRFAPARPHVSASQGAGTAVRPPPLIHMRRRFATSCRRAARGGGSEPPPRAGAASDTAPCCSERASEIPCPAALSAVLSAVLCDLHRVLLSQSDPTTTSTTAAARANDLTCALPICQCCPLPFLSRLRARAAPPPSAPAPRARATYKRLGGVRPRRHALLSRGPCCVPHATLIVVTPSAPLTRPRL